MNRPLRRLAFIVAALALLLARTSAPALAAAPPVIRFSILSAEDQHSMSSYWQPLIEDMKSQTRLPVQAFYSSNYTTLVQAMAFNQTQIGWFSADPAVEAIARANGEVVARTIDDQGRGFYTSVILARKDSGLTLDRLLACGRRLSFGLGDPSSTSGTLAPLYYLFQPRRIDPQACFRVVRSASHQANLLSVANGTIDAATNNSVGLAYYRSGSGPVRDAVARTRVIWTSPDLPEAAIVLRKDLPPDVKARLTRFFVTYGQGVGAEAERQRAILKRLKYSAFAPADDSYLKPVVAMKAAVAAAGGRTRRTGGMLTPLLTVLNGSGARAGLLGLLALALLAGAAILLSRRAPADPAAPRRRALDILIWGGAAWLLAVSAGPVELGKVGLLVSNSANMRAFAGAFLRPDFTAAADYVAAMALTLQIALWGTVLAVLIGAPLGILGARNLTPPAVQQPVRRLLDLLRAVPDLVIGTMFIVAVGLGPFAGVMALAINTGGVLGKLFSEAVEAADPQPQEGVRAVGAVPVLEVLWGVLPQVAPLWISYTLYRFESNARSATILGLIGAGGIGQLLFDSLNAFKYSETAAIILVIVAAVSLIDLLSQGLRSRLL